jgi:hypothetical protein
MGERRHAYRISAGKPLRRPERRKEDNKRDLTKIVCAHGR